MIFEPHYFQISPTITHYSRHRRSRSPVREINLKACALVISNWILRGIWTQPVHMQPYKSARQGVNQPDWNTFPTQTGCKTRTIKIDTDRHNSDTAVMVYGDTFAYVYRESALFVNALWCTTAEARSLMLQCLASSFSNRTAR